MTKPSEEPSDCSYAILWCVARFCWSLFLFGWVITSTAIKTSPAGLCGRLGTSLFHSICWEWVETQVFLCLLQWDEVMWEKGRFENSQIQPNSNKDSCSFVGSFANKPILLCFHYHVQLLPFSCWFTFFWFSQNVKLEISISFLVVYVKHFTCNISAFNLGFLLYFVVMFSSS